MSDDIDKVVFAEDSVTVHKVIGKPTKQDGELFYPTISVNLFPGQTFPLEELAPDQKERVLSGTAYGLKLLTNQEVKDTLDERDRVLALMSTEPQPENVLKIS